MKTDTPICELCHSPENILVLRNKAKVCRTCRRLVNRLCAPVGPAKVICKRRTKARRVSVSRDAGYKRWLRGQECAIYFFSLAGQCSGPMDPAHTAHNNGMSSKGSDSSCAPLCRKHHTEYDGGRVEFEKKYGIDMGKLAAENYARFQHETGKVAA